MADQSGLERYRKKRDQAASPEPFGEGSQLIPPGVFVVHKHAARNLHYDLRLEVDGRLTSWAVPKGPSFDPEVKRLAMKVEDHPLDYVDFEGVIPEGYGAGSMILWDRGRWVPLEDVKEGFSKGKLLFRLDGYKLRGVWTLFKAGKEDNGQWLWVKKPDDAAHVAHPPETSILSGLGVEELADPTPVKHRVTAELSMRPKGGFDFGRASPMLAEVQPHPFDHADWLFELKYDGFRLMANKDKGKVRLRYRSGRSATRAFPELVAGLAALPYDSFIIDGEVVVFDHAGKPVFNKLQQRVQLERERDLAQARWSLPASYMVFDLLELEGKDTSQLELHRRKALLKSILPDAGAIRWTDHVEQQGKALYTLVEAQGLEGIMAKRRSAPYRSARCSDWLKIRCEKTEALAVIGYTAPKGSRTGFGGLHLARPLEGGWRYVGRVGSGFDGELLDSLSRRFEALVIEEPVCPVSKVDKTSVWLKPEVVIEVTYLTETEEGILRQSRLRAVREEPAELLLKEGDLPPFEGKSAGHENEYPLSNPTKIFYPQDGFTKRDILSYYQAIGPWMLPYLEDRPLAVVRYPDGIEGKSFFQKHAPKFTPGWIRTERVKSERRETEEFVGSGMDGIAFLVNLGTIPFHTWASRVQSLERPTWCVLDLDPKGAPFSSVLELALGAKVLFDQVGLTAAVKTSGSTGLHLMVPLAERYDYEQAKILALILAKVLVTRHPNLATLEYNLEKRGGKIYVDMSPNGRGKLCCAPYSLRERPGATVSTPVLWSEVEAGFAQDSFTIETVPERMRSLDRCPLSDVLGEGPDLAAIVGRLQSLA